MLKIKIVYPENIIFLLFTWISRINPRADKLISFLGIKLFIYL